MMDNVNIIIFLIEYARQTMPEWEAARFESPKGRGDHVGFSVENLAVRWKDFAKRASR
jgi:hypothetical protein